MSHILKKNRSKNYLMPAVFLTGATTAAIVGQTASADTVTGWDTNGSNGSVSDANSAIASASSNAESNASSKASDNTSNAPAVTGSSSIGWVDVYVDHSKLDDAVQNAIANGLDVVHDPSVVLTGDATETVKNTTTAKEYYASQAAYINSVAQQYTIDMANYQATVDKNRANATQANAEMDALRSNLAAQGQTTKLVSKQYSAEGVESDKAKVQQGIADGRTYLKAKELVANANTQQDAMALFGTAAAQGHVKINRTTVTIANEADAQKYIDDLNKQYQELQDYLNDLPNQNGSIPDDKKPTYNLYTFVVDPTVEAKGTAPVETYNYTPIPVTKPVKPSVNYHYYDIRSKPTSNSGYDNADGEHIIMGPNANAGGATVAQAMVNQTIGINTDNQPLPAHRWDKIQDLTIITKLPDNVEFDLAKSNTDPTNWNITYDKETNTVTQTATAAYLVQVNLNQNPNNGGTVGGTTDGEWKYQAPQVYFKLLKDDTTYQASSTTIVNKEYMFVGQGIQIRTDSADPSKANANSVFQNIDGKAVLPGSINNYVLGWDFNQYKGVNIDSNMRQQGLHLVDDFPEDAVELTGPISVVDPATGLVLYQSDIPAGATVGSTGTFKDASGKTVDGFVWKVIDNDTAPDNLKGKLKGQAIILSCTDDDFYKKYVQGGHSLNVVIPMTTKKIDNTPDKPGGSYNGNEYTNVAWQSDFGNEYKSNEVTNTAPKLDPNKDAVLSYANLQSLDINKNPSSAIENGSHFQYRLSGSKLPTNLSEDLKSYTFTDEIPAESDEYSGEFIVENGSVIKFKKGSTLAQRYPDGIPANSDISKYFTQTIRRNEIGSDGKTTITKVILSADADFLSQIDYDKTNFQVDAYLTVKRVANNQKVRNVFNENINGIDYGSNEVFTNSRANAFDDLQNQLNSLQSSASSGIASNSNNIASMGSALSVIIASIDSVRDSTSSAVSSLASDIESNAANSSAINSLFDWTNEQISSVASSASSAIASNSSQIGDVASSTSSQMSSLASQNNAAIKSLSDALASKTNQNTATLIITDKTVTSEAQALSYAVNQGVAPGSIKSITKNEKGNYVVTYNASSTAINGSKPADTKPTKPVVTNKPTVTGSTNGNVNSGTTVKHVYDAQVTFYTCKSEAEVYRKLAAMGYPRTSVVSIKQNGSTYTAVVKK